MTQPDSKFSYAYKKTCAHLKQKGGAFLEFFLLCFFLFKMLRISTSLTSVLVSMFDQQTSALLVKKPV